MPHDVFISYKSEQNEIANAVCHFLEEHGIKCWMAPRNIPVGSDYAAEIVGAIMGCKVTILIFSELSATSPWVRSEINIAFSNNKPILPYKVDITDFTKYYDFYLMLNNRHWIESVPDYRARFNDLLTAISKIVGVSIDKPQNPKQKKYKVGDFYNKNGKEGVVFYVDETGQHGKIVSMQQAELQWAVNVYFVENKNKINPSEIEVGAVSNDNGMDNMDIIIQEEQWQEKYPAFAWCAEKGDGWYLPSINELRLLLLNAEVHDSVNRKLEHKKAVRLFNRGEFEGYWSSTELCRFGVMGACTIHVASAVETTFPKWGHFFVRAVATF